MIRVLLVDDHQIVRKRLRELLESHGWNVCGEATDGKKALESVLVVKPEIVLMDVFMPLMNGFEAAKEIHRVAPNTRIVLVSSHDSAVFEEEARKAGADAYLDKSRSADELDETLIRVLKQNGNRQRWAF